LIASIKTMWIFPQTQERLNYRPTLLARVAVGRAMVDACIDKKRELKWQL
jgi:hypothetical protein